MNREDIIRMAREAGAVVGKPAPDAPEIIFSQCMDVERFAALVAQRERDKLTVMFLEAHEGAKDNHNYWHVAANKIKEKK